MMVKKTARPIQPLTGFEPNHPQEFANHKTFRAFVAAAALLAGGCSGGAGAIAPITPNSGGTGTSMTPNSGSVTASSAQSMMRQSAVSSSTYSSAVLSSSPTAYFRLDEMSGTTALDSSGRGFNMVMRSGVTKGSAGLVAGDTAVTLPGISNSADVIMSNGRNSALEPATTVSLEAWIKPAAMPSSGRAVIAAYGDDDVNAPYELFLLSTTQIVWKLDVSGGKWLTSTARLSVGSVYHIVGTYDGATMRLYINGALDSSLVTSGNIGNYAYANRNLGFTIGDDGHLVDGSFKGVVDEVAVYALALSASDVSSHYAAANGTQSSSPTPTPPTPSPTPTASPTANPTATPTSNPTQPPSGSGYAWDSCSISWPYYTTNHYGAAASSDSSSIMSHLASRFSANGYQDYFSVGNTVYVNDVPANQPTTTMTANHGHTYPSNWQWPTPASPTVEGGFSGDAQMIIVQHTSPCVIWESTSTAKTGSGYSSWTAGTYSTAKTAGNEVFQNPAGTNPDGAGPTEQSNLIADVKWEEVQSGQVNHALELVLPPCSPAGSRYVYPAARAEGIQCASDQSSMPYGATWIMSPNPPSGCDKNADAQSAAIIYALKNYGAVLLNTTGSTTNAVFYAANGLGVRYPATSSYRASALGRCHMLTDGYILPHSAIASN